MAGRKAKVLSTAVVAVAMLLIMLPVAAQQPDPGAEDPPELAAGPQLIGMIPGTAMLRDEFRARAFIQLKAVALSALTYRLLHDDAYPPDLYTLKNSDSWNLDVLNMFTGKAVQAIYFEPQEGDYTTRPLFDVPMAIEMSGGAVGGLDDDGSVDLGNLGQTLQDVSLDTSPRVDAQQIRLFSGGDIYYYVAGDLLQLIMFAPDGSYVEHVDHKPNGRWRAELATPAGGLWPSSVSAAQVLFFTEELVLRHHNLVEFMGDRETVPSAGFEGIGAAERIERALDLGIVVLNPFTDQPAMVSAEPSVGDFAEAGEPLPLLLWMRDGRSWSLGALHEEADGAAGSDGSELPSRPPLGGR